ncbi:TIGR02757 family protein [Thermoflavifilum thermophilum]|uniref:TIGR02757 family protein n=1 Tax=Thermoflavifilum thermophilum TaxID=1393122 RepID=A0A1I7NAA1_9BACT|nr:TIGR02757 family protein [Thermoflavifilum thermophilum]SFV31568.1 TIGR02757 family protein [Thermoflavifilum thermophilum]
MNRQLHAIKKFLDEKFALYHHPDFIAHDPISVPHRFTQLQDIEISGFFTALMAWGSRTSIINSANRLMQLMDDAPYEFITQHQPADLKRFLSFSHRTFQPTDLLFFISFLREYYQHFISLESAFAAYLSPNSETVEAALNGFYQTVFSDEYPERTKKHLPAPFRGSSCKRLNMFLRWMVRRDDMGIDFGCWKQINPHQLICPMDVHVVRVARRLGLIDSQTVNWKTACLLTQKLRTFDADDPVKYDFALFGLGVIEKWV